MIGSSVVFAVGLWGLAREKSGGISTEQCLVFASCLSMVVRITYAGNHIRAFFDQRIATSDILPHPLILGIAAVGAAVLRRLEGFRVLIGVGAFGIITLAAL
jgi:hypothetical protein